MTSAESIICIKINAYFVDNVIFVFSGLMASVCFCPPLCGICR